MRCRGLPEITGNLTRSRTEPAIANSPSTGDSIVRLRDPSGLQLELIFAAGEYTRMSPAAGHAAACNRVAAEMIPGTIGFWRPCAVRHFRRRAMDPSAGPESFGD